MSLRGKDPEAATRGRVSPDATCRPAAISTWIQRTADKIK